MTPGPTTHLDLGDGLAIRALRQGDAADMQRAADDPRVARNLRDAFPSPYTLEDAHNYIANVQDQDPVRQMGITKDDRVVGGIGLHPQEAEHAHTAEIGFYVGVDHWGQGIATRAVRAMVGYGFDRFEVERIYAHVFSWNPASRRVLEKAGLSFEGTLRRAFRKLGETLDLHLYSALREEWPA